MDRDSIFIILIYKKLNIINQMELLDFIPNYLPITDKDFESSIANKEEFRELILSADIEKVEKGELLKHQLFIQRFLSTYTPYTSLLLYHTMGTGKSCSAVGVVENAFRNLPNIFTGKAMIFSINEQILSNFKNAIAKVCTINKYQTKKDDQLPKVTKNYIVKTFHALTKINFDQPEQVKSEYSNRILIFDEIQGIIGLDKKAMYKKGSIYMNLWELLHLVDNCKILLMSGTPMINDPSESADILNLILPRHKQLKTGRDFDYYLKSQKGIDEFKELTRGYISFLKQAVDPDITVHYVGKPYHDIKKLNVTSVKMEKDQEQVYLDAYKEDTKNQEEDEEKDEEESLYSAFFTRSQQASLFAYDGKYGNKLYGKKLQPFYNKIVNEIGGDIKKLEKFSAKYAFTVKTILSSPPGINFVFCKYIDGSGTKLLNLILSSFKISFINLSTIPEGKLNETIDRVNSDTNIYGEQTKVIIGSKKISEGYTFKNVTTIIILSPFDNYSRIEQAIYRCIRYGSHDKLKEKGNKVIVSIYMVMAVTQDIDKSIDMIMYKRSEDKDIQIQKVRRIIMESSVDCINNYARNYNPAFKDKSRDCEYQTCKFKCDAHLKKCVDYTTFDLFYLGDAETKTSRFYKIMENLKCLFHEKFQFTYNELKEILQVTDYQLLTVVDYMISNHISITNRFGFENYLYEENNMFFLTSQINNKTYESLFYNEHVALEMKTEMADLMIDEIFDHSSIEFIDFFENSIQVQILKESIDHGKKDILKKLSDYFYKDKDGIYIINKGTVQVRGIDKVWTKDTSIINTELKKLSTAPDIKAKFIKILVMKYIIDHNLDYTQYKKYITQKAGVITIHIDNIQLFKVKDEWTDKPPNITTTELQHDMFVKGIDAMGLEGKEVDGVKPFCILHKSDPSITDARKKSSGRNCITAGQKNVSDMLKKYGVDIGKKKTITELCSLLQNYFHSQGLIKYDPTCGSPRKLRTDKPAIVYEVKTIASDQPKPILDKKSSLYDKKDDYSKFLWIGVRIKDSVKKSEMKYHYVILDKDKIIDTDIKRSLPNFKQLQYILDQYMIDNGYVSLYTENLTNKTFDNPKFVLDKSKKKKIYKST